MRKDTKTSELDNLHKFTIVTDTREQTPWTFPEGQHVITSKLDAGDYSVEGYENAVAIERKTLNDYCNTVIGQKKRFDRELDKLQAYRYPLIVVEANVSDIVEQRYTCKSHPMSILGRTIAIMTYRGIPVVFWGNRQTAQWLAEKWLRKVWEREMGKIQQVKEKGKEQDSTEHDA